MNRFINKLRQCFGFILAAVLLAFAAPQTLAQGRLVSWGDNSDNIVGGTPTGDDFAAVSASWRHAVAARTDGSLVSWGWDEFNQVSATPAGNDFRAVSAGGLHSVAIRTNGTHVAWGPNLYGQISGPPTGNNFGKLDTRTSRSTL